MDLASLASLAARLGELDRDVDDATLVDRIRALEVLKAAASAAQAHAAAALDVSQRAAQAAAGVPAAELGRGVAAQVALARRDSPHRGGQHLGQAKALVHEMPRTLAALQSGRISEWRATILVRETAVLTREHRSAVDDEVASDLGSLEQLGDRALAARVKQVAYRLDPRSVVERARRAERERRVTIRAAPDTMAYLTALLPARDAIAAHTSLARAADAARNQGTGPEGGETRGRGQLMADLLVASCTGAAPGSRGPEDVAVRLVMTDRALLDGDPEPAHLDGYGPVPAAWARDLVAAALDPAAESALGDGGTAGTNTAGQGADGGGAPGDGSPGPAARVFVKRLLTDRDGALVAMDSRARVAPAGLAALIRTRDAGTCRTPWCDAPARHVDHVVPHARGGPTNADNLQGLCEACNQAKEALG